MRRLMPRFLVVGLALVALAGCAPESRRAVRPSDPGPVDMLRGLFGDYRGRCPDDYTFCKSGRSSICCPYERGCCEDSQGAYCCSRRGGDDDWRDRRRSEDDRDWEEPYDRDSDGPYDRRGY